VCATETASELTLYRSQGAEHQLPSYQTPNLFKPIHMTKAYFDAKHVSKAYLSTTNFNITILCVSRYPKLPISKRMFIHNSGVFAGYLVMPQQL
jgi:hypothetical protein